MQSMTVGSYAKGTFRPPTSSGSRTRSGDITTTLKTAQVVTLGQSSINYNEPSLQMIQPVQPYSTTVTGTTGGVKRRRGRNKHVVHPLFAECATICQDPFWVNILTEAAYGKFPKRFSFQNGNLTHRKGTREMSRTLSTVPAEALASIIDFFRRYESLNSEADKRASYISAAVDVGHGALLDQMVWDNYNSHTQQILIRDFIERMTVDYQLSPYESSDLKYNIGHGVFLGTLTGNNIIVADRKIQYINGLHMNPAGTNGQRSFYLDPTLVATKIPTKRKEVLTDLSVRIPAKDQIPGFHKKWSKYLSRQATNYRKYSKYRGTGTHLNPEFIIDECNTLSVHTFTDTNTGFYNTFTQSVTDVNQASNSCAFVF